MEITAMPKESQAIKTKEFNIAAALLDINPKEAVSKVTFLLDEYPADSEALFLRAKCWLKLNLYSFALHDLKDAFELFSTTEGKNKCKQLINKISPGTEIKHNESESSTIPENNPPKDFIPPLDLVTIFHAFFNYTKFKHEVELSDHITDLSRADMRRYCNRKRFNLPLIANLDELKKLSRELGTLSMILDFKHDNNDFKKAYEKFNEINGERAAEDLIEMLEKGITTPTRTEILKNLLHIFERTE